MGLRCSFRMFKTRQLFHLFSNPVIYSSGIYKSRSFRDDMCKVFHLGMLVPSLYEMQRRPLGGPFFFHSGQFLNIEDKALEPVGPSGQNAVANSPGEAKKKRKKLKGRSLVKWLKFFRWKKKKEYERMTAEEKILYKLRKARKKEERLAEAMKKIEPKESTETTHDPEILTPEEHFYYLKMGQKCKNYVPVGRRGIYQGVILNMHLHWKKHQTLKVVVKTFSAEEVREIAAELARLSGGIVLYIQEDNTIIMYRGRNYSQPPTEIMSPRTTLSRKKALDNSKYRDGLRAVRKYIPRLEQDLELLRAKAGSRTGASEQIQTRGVDRTQSDDLSSMHMEASDKLGEIMDGNVEIEDEDDPTMDSDSEALSDIFETDADTDSEEKAEQPLYLNTFEKFPVQSDGEPEDLEEHLRQISADSRKAKSLDKGAELPEFDEVDKIFLQAASLLKKKRK